MLCVNRVARLVITALTCVGNFVPTVKTCNEKRNSLVSERVIATTVGDGKKASGRRAADLHRGEVIATPIAARAAARPRRAGGGGTS